MQSQAVLRDYFSVQEIYRRLYDDYVRRGVQLDLNPIDSEFASGTDLDDYLTVGADAMRVIVAALSANTKQPPVSILDFPSGSGRVARHLQSFFPGAEVVCSDLYERHLAFCKEVLGTSTVMANADPEKIDFTKKFDLIFCGSLLTHLPAPQFSSALRLLSRSLTDQGIAIVSLHGRYSQHVQKNKPNGSQYMPDDEMVGIDAEIEADGFSYRDYDADVRSGLFAKQASYGVSFSLPHHVTKLLEPDLDIRILGYTERGWHHHQDVLVFGRPGVNAG